MALGIEEFKDLTAEQHKLLVALEANKQFCRHFYLTGGTLLKALGIVPRQSNDLDFFTFADIDSHTFTLQLQQLRTALEMAFGAGAIELTDRGFMHQPTGMVIDVVADNVSNIGDFVSFGQLKTASLQDVTAHKASAICSRDEVKDYIDIAFLTKQQNWLLKDLANLAEKKFNLGTIGEEKLLTEILAKQKQFTLAPSMFLRSPEGNIHLVQEQIQYLIEHTSL